MKPSNAAHPSATRFLPFDKLTNRVSKGRAGAGASAIDVRSIALLFAIKEPPMWTLSAFADEISPDLDQQLKDYHRELDFAREYFPEADIRDVDGTRKPAVVAGEVRKLLDERRR